MTRAIRIVATDFLRGLLTRRSTIVLIVLLFALLTAISCSLQISGQTMINGHVTPLDEGTRADLAMATAFGGTHFLGLVLILFVLVPAIVGELDSGLASWMLVKPLPRRTYLLGRMAGCIAFLGAFSGFVVLGLQILLARYSGAIAPSAFLGWGILAVLLVGYLAWGVLLALHLGVGFGGIALLFLVGAGAVIDTDALTRVFFPTEGEAGAGGILGALLFPLLHGEPPPLLARAAYGLAYLVLPGTGNVHDLAVAMSSGRSLSIPFDAVSFAIVIAGIPVGIALGVRAVARREF